jgi:capsular polysaccharide biosynthesis protein
MSKKQVIPKNASPVILKVWLKRFFSFLDSLLGYTFKIIDYRQSPDNSKGVLLTEPVRLKGINPKYRIETGEKPYWLEILKEGILLPPFAYYILPDSFLIGRGIMLNEKKELILESTIFQREYLNKLIRNHLVLRSKFSSTAQKLPPVIPLLNRLSNNYYHWTTEQLARLAVLVSKTDIDIHQYNIVITKNAPCFVKESLLMLFHIRPEKIIEWQDDEIATTEKSLLIAYNFIRTPKTRMTNVYHPDIYFFLSKIADENIDEKHGTYTYLILSRKNSNQRNLLGEDKIAESFPQFPFEVITLEDMPFGQQLQLFRRAKIIIGSHGAGFANLIYCKYNPLVIEIFPATRKIRDSALFYQITDAKKLRHHLIIQPPVNNQQDMEVDSVLIERITSVINKHVKTVQD